MKSKREAAHEDTENVVKTIPPDGGWGWMVVLGYALNNLVMIPLITGMGLIFKDLFKELNFPDRDASIIMSVNMAFGMLMGFTHGPLLRIFGYRKIALTGSTMFVTGLLMTGLSNKFIHLLFSHGFITSYGISLTMASFSLAINTYFLEKRTHAMGLAMTITGFGPIIMPQIITLLADMYPNKHAIFVLGAISLHTVVASLLLQPIKWHSKKNGVYELKDNTEKVNQIDVIKDLKPNSVITEILEKKRTISVSSLNDDVRNLDLQEIEVTEERKKSQFLVIRGDSVDSLPSKRPSIQCFRSIQNVLLPNDESRTRYHSQKWQSPGENLHVTHFGSCPMLLDEPFAVLQVPRNIERDTELEEKSEENNERESSRNGHVDSKYRGSINTSESNENGSQRRNFKIAEECNHLRSRCCNCLNFIIKFFDLELLCDVVYVNIMVGMAIAAFAEINFAVLIPFILKDIDFGTGSSATVMTVIAAVDLIMRGLAPFIGQRLRQTPRIMYMLSLVMLIGSRMILVYARSFTAIIFMGIGTGFAKGFKSVFMYLIVPNHVPIERLADASGIQTVVTGLVLMTLGPFIGVIRELRGSYDLCIILINGMTMLAILMWIIEMLITRFLNNRKKNKEQRYQQVAIAE